MFSANNRHNLYEQVVNELGLRIIQGKYEIGGKLPQEDELSAEFGVSRTVIREATKVLVEKGLVQSQRKVGTRIQLREDWNLLDSDILNWEYQGGERERLLRNITELRRIIEPEAASLAALRATDQEIAQIREAYHEMASVVDDADQYIVADLAFHSLIVKACHNELIEQTVITMRQALVASRKTTTQIPNSSEDSLPSHLAVLHAIEKHDSDEAANKMRHLIDRTWADIKGILSIIE